MELDFNRVNYDGDLSDFDAEELRELVSEFESAQESNLAEFETAAEELDEVEKAVPEEYEAARADLIEDITEAETFDQVPLSEEDLEDEDFASLRDWLDFVQDAASEDEDETDEEDGEFDDMGKEAPVNDPEDGVPEFAKRKLGDMQGVVVED